MDRHTARQVGDAICEVLCVVYGEEHSRFAAQAKKRGTTVEGLAAAAIVTMLGQWWPSSGHGFTQSRAGRAAVGALGFRQWASKWHVAEARHGAYWARAHTALHCPRYAHTDTLPTCPRNQLWYPYLPSYQHEYGRCHFCRGHDNPCLVALLDPTLSESFRITM